MSNTNFFLVLKKLVIPQSNGKKFYETVDGSPSQAELLEAEQLGFCTHVVKSHEFVSGSWMEWHITEKGKQQYASLAWEREEWKYDKFGRDLQGKKRPTLEEFAAKIF